MIGAVVIDGIEFVPRNTVIPDSVNEHLLSLYSTLFIQAVYDPDNDSTHKLAKELFPHISAINDVLKFKK